MEVLGRVREEPRGGDAAGEESPWVARMKAGSSVDFGRIVERHQAAILAHCLRSIGDLALAKDAAQEVFLTLWRERDRYEDRGRLRFYLLRVAHHRCLDTIKKRRSRLRLVDAVRDAPREVGDVGVEIDRRRARVRMAEALGAIDPDRAALIRLRYLEGLALEEIQEVTGLPEGTIKSRLSRGIADLRKELQDVR